MKRFFDVVCSAAALILISPIIGAAALVIRVCDGKHVVFRQQRVGLNGELFTIYKFRTMKIGTRNAATNDLHESQSQVTKIGKVLRKTSLDELPQLWNILKGDMSFIGPRPLIPEESEIHELRKKAGVYKVRPGITGLAQVNGRDEITIEQKVKYDKEYADNRSLAMDIKILFKTVRVVLTGDGYAEGEESKKS